MALTGKSLFLYGFEVGLSNNAIDFRAVNGGPILYASITSGFYTLTGLCSAIKSAMEAADPSRTYTVSVNRTLVGGTQNRVRIATNGAYLDLLFGTGPRKVSSISSIIGFTQNDRTGATYYDGQLSAGASVVSEYIGYNYLGPQFQNQIFGAVNITANGTKEAVVWSVQKFFSVEFRYEPEAKVIAQWYPFLSSWAIQQKPLEFTPNINQPNTFYECTLESTDADGKGLGYRFIEMLPDFPFNYRTGNLKFRQR